MSHLSRIFGRRRGSASRETEVVTALRELEQTLQQVEEQLRSETSLSRRPPPERHRPDPPPPTVEEPTPELAPERPPPPDPAPAEHPRPDPPPRTVEEPTPEPAPERPLPPDPAPVPDEPLFAQSVELDVGPFADFGALSVFERELARLPDIAGVYVRRFLDDRAVVELTATRELPLLGLLHVTLSHRFEIEHVERGYLKITLSAE